MARRDGWRLVTSFNQSYWARELQSERPRPDATVVLEGPNDERLIVVCEYERALPGGRLAEGKVWPWVDWFADRRWSEDRIRGAMRNRPPLLLFVFGDHGRAPGSLVRAVEAMPVGIPACVGHENLLTDHGLHGEVWRAAGGGTVSLLALAHERAASVRSSL